jgi:hypothetical protein
MLQLAVRQLAALHQSSYLQVPIIYANFHEDLIHEELNIMTRVKDTYQ